MTRRLLSIAAALTTLLILATTAAGAQAAGTQAAGTTYAPLDQPGPPLTVPTAQLTASLSCEASVRNATVTPVLLNPATGVTAAENYSWNWEPALTKLGIPWCAYTAPDDTLADIPTSGEYLVYAIRTMYAMAGRRIDIMGHSQGGMSMRWALRFWPDTRSMVNDVIGFSGSNHGTQMITTGQCESIGCPAADWQQTYDSPFIEALNSDAETFAGISYTEIWTHTDEVVTPNGSPTTASAALHTGAGQITNVATQTLCPADVDEHLTIGTIDPVAYALAVDTLTHPGPADVARTQADNPSLCSELYMPGINPANLANELEVLKAAPGLLSVEAGPLATATSGAPVTKTAPTLPCYVYATCQGAAAPTLTLRLPFRHTVHRGSTPVHVQVLTREGSASEPVPNATVSLDGRHASTDAAGWVTVRAPLRAGLPYHVTARLSGANPAAATFRPR